MCQLTFINLNNKGLNYLASVTSFLTNTQITNKDGFGFFSSDDRNYLFKEENQPGLVTNLGAVINNRISDKPILQHVRFATFTNGVKTIDVSKCHPFKSKEFILAHNGSLDFEDKTKFNDAKYKDMIDSEIFLDFLQNEFDKESDFVKALNEAMNHFKGKFAFLIYDLVNKVYYAARGTSADLYISNFIQTNKNNATGGNTIGYMINTNKDDLIKTLMITCQAGFSKPGTYYYFTQPELLKNESIFRLDERKIEIIGGIKERYNYTYANQNYYQQRGLPFVAGNNINIKEDDEELSYFFRFLNTFKLTIPELDEILYLATGRTLLELTPTSIRYVKNDLEPFLLKFNTNQKSILWEKIRGTYLSLEQAIEDTGLQFPYMLNKIQDLNDVWKDIKHELKNPHE